ncbi:uncharacterized protein NPIL_482221 [Nephila pilipes]|uniref:Uncharacterized protein n=1 Tax=Nephila pilipes TaxID=299642 RepID=A0A8X6IIV6_NEPPI|nr:uncharacterized protein NPIL_482221 [Nephila pilipes]
MSDKNWEFECPQFYDFCNGVESNTQQFCFGGNSPALGNKRFPFKSTGHFQMKNKYMAWNNKLSTPRDKSPFVNVCPRPNTTDSEKLNEKIKRLSKSEGSFNYARINFNTLSKQESYNPILQRRSVSDSDLKKDKRKIAVTPMCLKRTIRKTKSKKIKTSEELELEKIAKLQSLTLKHLRYNEIAMKKLKLKQKPISVPKIPMKTEAKENLAKNFQIDSETILEKINRTRDMRLKIKETSVNENRFKRERLKAVSGLSDVAIPSKLLQSFASIHLDEIKTAEDETDIAQLQLPLKKYPAHSGLVFSMNNPKKAALRPFNFHEKTKDTGSEKFSKSILNESKINEKPSVNKAKNSHSLYASCFRNRDKENNLTLKTPRTDVDYVKKAFKHFH